MPDVKFNNIDNDFACPALCSMQTMLTGPYTCIEKIKAGSCVHPAATEVSPADLEFVALSPEISLRLFSSCFQHPVALVENEHGQTFLALDMGDEGYVPITQALEATTETEITAMYEQLSEIQELNEIDGL